MFSLTIAVATLASELDATIARLIDYKFDERVEVLIVSQREVADEAVRLQDNFHIIKSTSSGLSNSRNLAINESRGDWIWFQDSDFVPVEGVDKVVLNRIDHGMCDVLLGQIYSLENPSVPMKDYSRYHVGPRLLSFRVSSIELIVRRAFLKESEVLFDSNLGLGTSLPSCEENLFFYSAVVKNRARLSLILEPLCLHTSVIETRNIDYLSRYRARGYLLSKVSFALGLSIGLWWAVRATRDGVGRLERIFMLGQGLQMGFRGIEKKA